MEKLDRLKMRRNSLLAGLWLIYREMSDIQEADDMHNDDLAVWGTVTRHHSLQAIWRKIKSPKP